MPAQVPTRADRLLKQLYDSSDRHVMVAAHRGDWRNAPENSLRAIENAIMMGVDIVEIDIRRTNDGHFVLMHDSTLERTTTGRGKVSDASLDEIQQLYLKNGYGVATKHRVPTLERMLQDTKGRVLVYIDKSEASIDTVYKLAQRLGVENQVLFYGHQTQNELHTELGEVAQRIHFLPKLGDKTPHMAEYIAEHGAVTNTPAVVASFADVESPVLQQFQPIRKKGQRIWASSLWPTLCAGRTDDRAVDHPDEAWGWLIDHGATILCTDRPKLLLDYLRQKKLHE